MCSVIRWTFSHTPSFPKRIDVSTCSVFPKNRPSKVINCFSSRYERSGTTRRSSGALYRTRPALIVLLTSLMELALLYVTMTSCDSSGSESDGARLGGATQRRCVSSTSSKSVHGMPPTTTNNLLVSLPK